MTQSYRSRPLTVRSQTVRPERPPTVRQEGGKASIENAADIAANSGYELRSAPWAEQFIRFCFFSGK